MQAGPVAAGAHLLGEKGERNAGLASMLNLDESAELC